MRVELYILLFLFPFAVMGQKVVDAGAQGRYVKPGNQPAAWITPALWAYAISPDSVYLEWTDEAADSYVLQRATASDFSDAATIATTADTAYRDGGLSAWATYYYRVKALKSGSFDSQYATGQATALFQPVGWWEASMLPFTAGAGATGTNKYGTIGYTGTNDADTIRCVFGAAGDFVKVTSFDATLGGSRDWPSYIVGVAEGADAHANPNAALIAPPGQDFTLAWKVHLGDRGISSAGASILASSGGSTVVEIRPTLVIFRDTANAAIVNVTLGSSAIPDRASTTYYPLVDFVIQREADTMRVSTDGGETWYANNDTDVSTAVFRFGSLKGRYVRIMYDTVLAPSAQLSAFFDFERTEEQAEDISAGNNTWNGLTWSAWSGGYMVDTSLSWNPTASIIRKNVWAFGDYTAINLNEIFASPWYSDDKVYVIDHVNSQISGEWRVASPNKIVDVHHNGTLFPYNTQLYHIEHDVHYDKGGSSCCPVDSVGRRTLVVTTTGKDYNFAGQRRVRQQKQATALWYNLQYHQLWAIDSNAVIMAAQRWDGDNANSIEVGITRDNFASWEKNELCENDNTDWYYLNSIYSEDDTARLIVENYDIDNGNKYSAIYFLKTADGYNWQNLDGSFSQDIRRHNTIPKDTLHAYFRIDTATTGDIRAAQFFYDDGAGEIYGIIGTGQNDSLQLAYTSGNAWVFKTIDPGDSTLIVDVGQPDFSAAAVKRSVNTYDVYLHGDNGGSGDWNVLRYRTTDKGDTWAFQEKISTDDASKHKRIQITHNAEYANNIILTAARQVSASNAGNLGNSDVLIIDITTEP